MRKTIQFLVLLFLLTACRQSALEKKGFQVNEITEDEQGKKIVGLQLDSLLFETRPKEVLLTHSAVHRLIPLFKVNYDKKGNPFIGSLDYHSQWWDNESLSDNWHNHYMPGFVAVYGYNMVNVSHYNNMTKVQNQFFEKPVLIRTLYYPSFSDDTLNYKPVNRNYYMVSVYDEDTNKDGFINVDDLRHFYLFDMDGVFLKTLIPKNYSVLSSDYDSDNDYMYVFAKLDANTNGQMDKNESTHIFWIDLKDPDNLGVLYQ